MDREGWVHAALLELRSTYVALSDESALPVLPLSPPRFQATRGREDVAIRDPLFDRLRTDFELAFHPGVAVNQECDGLALVILTDSL